MTEYLKNRCYCPGEIYSTDGFFYQLFDAEDDCEKLGEHNDFIAVVCKTQIIIIWKNDDGTKVDDTIRYDATENNIKGIKSIIKGEQKTFTPDEFVEGSTAKSLKEIMSMADAIMID